MPKIIKSFHVNTSINSTLQKYYADFNSTCTEIKFVDICNGHLIIYFLEMKLGKSACSKKFPELLKNSQIISERRSYGACLSVINKYEYMNKHNKNENTIMEHLEKPLDIFQKPSVPELESQKNIKSTSNTSYLKLLKELTIDNNCEIDIYERYFDLSSQDLDSDKRNIELASLMEDAMSKLHDSELQIHKLKTGVKELGNLLHDKDTALVELETKLENDSKRGNIVVNLTKQLTQKKDEIIKLKFENSQMAQLLIKRNDLIKELEIQNSSLVEVESPNSSKEKGRGKKRKESIQNYDDMLIAKKERGNGSEQKITRLVTERDSSKISEILLELFPDISISDFEVILKILTDSDVLLGHRIIHKWNVNGKDIKYYGTIKENLKNQNKFYITYGKYRKEETDTDFEVVDYSILIADIISKDLSFLDPGSLF